MGWFGDSEDHQEAYDQASFHTYLTVSSFIDLFVLQFQNTPHKAELSHELIAAAASFEAAKAYEKHCAANGKPQSHTMAKELLAGFAGAFIDREVETRGLDYVDKEKAKHHAKHQVNEQFTEDIYVDQRY